MMQEQEKNGQENKKQQKKPGEDTMNKATEVAKCAFDRRKAVILWHTNYGLSEFMRTSSHSHQNTSLPKDSLKGQSLCTGPALS